ncbi:MAG: hypothetical protein ACR2N9_09910 [Acidimicrobiia bacterium]
MIVWLFVVRAMTAVGLRELGEDGPDPAPTAFREARAHVGDLIGVVARAVGVVVVLTITIVGIPWAIRQAVRYQFAPEATMLENRRGRDALERSSELVRGRWIHTAAFVLLTVALFLLFTTVVGLLLLIALSGIPLWLFSALVSALAFLVVPLTAAASTLLYGDARAELDGADAATPSETDDRPGSTPSGPGSARRRRLSDA